MANLAYVRVSTVEQNEERQIEGLSKRYQIDKWFTEKKSGKNTDRPELQKMLDYMRKGDTIYIWDFSRISRSTKDLLALIEDFQAKGVNLVSAKENLDTTTPTGKLMVTMIAAINEFERTNLLERQAEGIAIAKREGKFRKKEINEDNFKAAYEDWKAGKITKTSFAAVIGVSRPTLDKLLKQKVAQASSIKQKAAQASSIKQKAMQASSIKDKLGQS